MDPVHAHFRKTASSPSARRSEERWLQRVSRPGLLARRRLALSVVRDFDRPRVLDVGCGPGRVGEDMLEAGASRYVGVDFVGPMLALARQRLARFGERASFVEADYLTTELEETFDVVLVLGVFDYVPDAEALLTRARRHCSGTIAATFPRWTWLRGPARKFRYEVLESCPLHYYTEVGVRALFGSVPFARVRIAPRGRTGFLVRADV